MDLYSLLSERSCLTVSRQHKTMRKVETFLLHTRKNIMYFQFVDTHSDIWIHWNNSCLYNHHHPRHHHHHHHHHRRQCHHHHHHYHHHHQQQQQQQQQHVYTMIFWFTTLCSLVWCYKCFGWNLLLLCSRQKWVMLGLDRSYSSGQRKGWRNRDKSLPMSMGTGNRIGPNGSLQKERLFWRDKVAEESWVMWKCRACSSLVSSGCERLLLPGQRETTFLVHVGGLELNLNLLPNDLLYVSIFLCQEAPV